MKFKIGDFVIPDSDKINSRYKVVDFMFSKPFHVGIVVSYGEFGEYYKYCTVQYIVDAPGFKPQNEKNQITLPEEFLISFLDE